jgi:hypothetical protein
MIVLSFLLFGLGLLGIVLMFIIEVAAVVKGSGAAIEMSSIIIVPTLFLAAAVAKYLAT